MLPACLSCSLFSSAPLFLFPFPYPWKQSLWLCSWDPTRTKKELNPSEVEAENSDFCCFFFVFPKQNKIINIEKVSLFFVLVLVLRVSELKISSDLHTQKNNFKTALELFLLLFFFFFFLLVSYKTPCFFSFILVFPRAFRKRVLHVCGVFNDVVIFLSSYPRGAFLFDTRLVWYHLVLRFCIISLKPVTGWSEHRHQTLKMKLHVSFSYWISTIFMW